MLPYCWSINISFKKFHTSTIWPSLRAVICKLVIFFLLNHPSPCPCCWLCHRDRSPGGGQNWHHILLGGIPWVFKKTHDYCIQQHICNAKWIKLSNSLKVNLSAYFPSYKAFLMGQWNWNKCSLVCYIRKFYTFYHGMNRQKWGGGL